MERIYRLGTRISPLALRQVEEVLYRLKGNEEGLSNGIKVEIVTIDTDGDKDRYTPISKIEGSDFFTRQIDESLLKGDIDFAVHSAKDLPKDLKKGLSVFCITSSVDHYDVLVSKSGLKLDKLPYGARIGTSSLRRKEQLKKFRSDFEIVDIRGNIEDRLRLLDKEESLDAIVIAAAGLLRLGLEHRITERIPLDILKPHPLQGRLALVIREDDYKIRELLKPLIE